MLVQMTVEKLQCTVMKPSAFNKGPKFVAERQTVEDFQ